MDAMSQSSTNIVPSVRSPSCCFLLELGSPLVLVYSCLFVVTSLHSRSFNLRDVYAGYLSFTKGMESSLALETGPGQSQHHPLESFTSQVKKKIPSLKLT